MSACTVEEFRSVVPFRPPGVLPNRWARRSALAEPPLMRLVLSISRDGEDREVVARGKKMMFWGDIILHHPELIRELPRDIIALNWGYETDHPFATEAATFAKSKIPFYVCPGTSTWMTLIGRHDTGYEATAQRRRRVHLLTEQ